MRGQLPRPADVDDGGASLRAIARNSANALMRSSSILHQAINPNSACCRMSSRFYCAGTTNAIGLDLHQTLHNFS